MVCQPSELRMGIYADHAASTQKPGWSGAILQTSLFSDIRPVPLPSPRRTCVTGRGLVVARRSRRSSPPGLKRFASGGLERTSRCPDLSSNSDQEAYDEMSCQSINISRWGHDANSTCNIDSAWWRPGVSRRPSGCSIDVSRTNRVRLPVTPCAFGDTDRT